MAEEFTVDLEYAHNKNALKSLEQRDDDMMKSIYGAALTGLSVISKQSDSTDPAIIYRRLMQVLVDIVAVVSDDQFSRDQLCPRRIPCGSCTKYPVGSTLYDSCIHNCS